MARGRYKKSSFRDRGRYFAKNHYDHDYDASDGTKGCERGMLFQFVCYEPDHLLLRQLRLSAVTARTEAGKLGNVVFGMKAQTVGKLVFPLA